jgi:serpin B
MSHIYSFKLAACLVPVIASLGCDSDPQKQNVVEARSSAVRVTDPQVSAADAATFAKDNEVFALSAYHGLAKDDTNLVFSPSSISIALSMTYAGAAGTTATEMASAMHFTLPPERLHPAFDALDLALSSRGEGKQGADGGPMRLHVVNSAWAERTYTFKNDYLDLLAVNYGAGIRLLDFIGASESARVTINGWVADQTEQKIKDLLPAGSVGQDTRLVLANAVYFNAAWLYPFDAHNTFDGTFNRLDGTTVSVKTMGSHLASVPAVKVAGYSAVALPYQDDRLSLLLVIPDAGTFAAFDASLDASKLDGIIASLISQQVLLDMPRFKVETGSSLADLLKGLGMPSAFVSGVADFSGMDGTRSLYISDVIHKAFIDVAEKGTEAAAATATTMNGSALPTGITVSADHPFLYFLRDQPTGAILFMGRVLDPSKN